jgi:hypothetical protein
LRTFPDPIRYAFDWSNGAFPGGLKLSPMSMVALTVAPAPRCCAANAGQWLDLVKYVFPNDADQVIYDSQRVGLREIGFEHIEALM